MSKYNISDGTYKYIVQADGSVKGIFVPIHDEPVEYPAPTNVPGYIYIESLYGHIQLRQPVSTEVTPHELKVYVPSVELPQDELEINENVTNEVLKYVRYDNMPPELKNVILCYLRLLTGGLPNSIIEDDAGARMRSLTKKLHEKICETFPETPVSSRE